MIMTIKISKYLTTLNLKMNKPKDLKGLVIKRRGIQVVIGPF